MGKSSKSNRRQFLAIAVGAAAGAGLVGYFNKSDSSDSSGGTSPETSSYSPTATEPSITTAEAVDPRSVDNPEEALPEELTESPVIKVAEVEEGTGMFTKAEIEQHRASIEQISASSASYLDGVYRDHTEFYNEHSISKYFGNRNPRYQTLDGRIEDIVNLGGYTQDKAAAIADRQEPTACILLTMQALEHGFNEAGMAPTWQKIRDQLAIDNKFLGTDLQIMLQELGWKIYYWNPEPSQNAAWDSEDKQLNPLKPGKEWNPVWGGHAIRYSNVQNKQDSQGRGIYDLHGPGVDDFSTLVGFGNIAPEALAAAPFFVGIAHAGYHVFPGSRGEVIEAHSMRKLNDASNVEVSEFNPLKGGGPRWTNSEKYRSGLIAVPYDL